MRKLFTAAAVMLMVMLLASCSYVFSSLISVELTGEVNGTDGELIDGAKILVYDSREARDADYEAALHIYTRGSYQEMENSSVIHSYTTEGIISSMSLVWKTSSSAYGEDKDIHPFYFLVLKDGYRPAITDFRVTSGSGSLGGNSVRIGNLEEIYNAESRISGLVTDDSENNPVNLGGIKIYAFDSKDDRDGALKEASGLFSINPDSYANSFSPDDYHSVSATQSDGRYTMKVMWNTSDATNPSSHDFYIFAVGNGFNPDSVYTGDGRITCNSDESMDYPIKLEKATKVEETV